MALTTKVHEVFKRGLLNKMKAHDKHSKLSLLIRGSDMAISIPKRLMSLYNSKTLQSTPVSWIWVRYLTRFAVMSYSIFTHSIGHIV